MDSPHLLNEREVKQSPIPIKINQLLQTGITKIISLRKLPMINSVIPHTVLLQYNINFQ